ncbi:MAG: isopeptide-forming domain-containing fimbrial protein [Lachnospiraceae bacterium]|nr:isopeptide-forming domain-containing fimbrial protein [Lachnospiraceae bacterium]
MKKTRKIAAMIAAMALTAAMCVPTAMMSASAVDPTYTVTIEDNGNISAKTHSFSAYQLIAGTPNAEDDAETLTGTDSAFTWGAALDTATKQDAFITAVKTAFASDSTKTKVAALQLSTAESPATPSTPYQVAEALGELTSASDAAKLAAAIDGISSTLTATQTYAGNGAAAKLTGLNGGYYFIKDTTTINPTSNDASSKFILQVVSNQTVTIKTDAPTLEKKIWHNDSTTDAPNTEDNTAPTFNTTVTGNGWADVGDNQIGDTVYYCIKTYIPDMSEYETYKYQINDTFSDGLTYDTTAGVTKIEVFDKTGAYVTDLTAETTDTGIGKPDVTASGQTLTVNFVDLKACLLASSDITDLTNVTGGYIYTYYQATLNADALVSGGVNGQQNNPNTANLTYSNNPNQSGSGTHTTSNTPDDTVYEWTYTYEIDKTDENNQPLAGATFSVSVGGSKLYFVPLTGADLTAALAKVKTADDTALTAQANTLYYRVAKAGDTGATQTIGDASDTTNTKYYLIGLDDTKTYSIAEESAPATYSRQTTADEKTISDTYSATGNALASLNGEDAGGLGVDTIQNFKNSTLPSTGGMGTTLFILGGGVTAACAGIYLVSKKRTKEETAE